MTIINVFENGLNVQYVPHFIEKERADEYLMQLKTLPFYTPTFKIRGKTAKPKRLMLAYGDENLTYAFSGTSIAAEPWTPLMLELRDRVEKFAACTFNYVLLNLYTDGTNYISQHKDNESGLDAAFPIVTLSFGAERTIEFKKPHTSSTTLKLEHGSLYTMLKPTNKLFTHGIAPEPNVNEPRISLTFRHLLTNSIHRPLKKPRLVVKNESSNVCEKDCFPSSSACEKNCLPVNSEEKNMPSTSCENTTSASSDLCVDEKDNSVTNDCSSITAEWDLNQRTFLQIMLDTNCNIRLHIRVFKETKNGDLLPTRNGIIMTPSTWLSFIGKISNFKFQTVDESFICNNQLIVISVDEDFCLMQQIFPLNTLGFFLKPSVLKLYSDQVNKLKELVFEITESIIAIKFKKQLPKLILNSSFNCLSHISFENAKQNFLDCLSSEINECISNIHNNCEACIYFPENQELHTCVRTVFHQFIMNRQEIFFNLNLSNLIRNLSICCSCHYTPEFFNKFNVDELIEDMLP